MLFCVTIQETKAGPLLTSYRTEVPSAKGNRTHNIRLAAEKLQIVVYPKQLISFNEVIGKRTTKKGYKEATSFWDKKKVKSVGGGICQVSSTLYAALLNLGKDIKIVERHPHSLPVSYLPKGLDATVSWKGKDLKFVNCFPFPIYIRTIMLEKTLWVEIYIY